MKYAGCNHVDKKYGLAERLFYSLVSVQLLRLHKCSGNYFKWSDVSIEGVTVYSNICLNVAMKSSYSNCNDLFHP